MPETSAKIEKLTMPATPSDPENHTANAPIPFKVQIIPVTPLQQNCSLIFDEGSKEAVFVDPGGDVEQLEAALKHFGLKLTQIWLTHGHLDHAGAAQSLKESWNVDIVGPHKEDQWLLDDIEAQGAKYGITTGRNTKSDQYLDDGDTLEFAGHTFGVVHCPGHTPGHVVIYNEAAQLAFVGDVIFHGSIGRTDFPRGNHQELLDSITQKLWPLGKDMRFIPGHGQMSTFGQERLTNNYVADSVLARK